jgi:hypothetical protein
MTPPGLVKPEEIPPEWGLLEVHPKHVRQVIEAAHREKQDWRREHSLLVSALRRIGQDPPQGLRVKAYTYQTKCRATVGIAE